MGILRLRYRSAQNDKWGAIAHSRMTDVGATVGLGSPYRLVFDKEFVYIDIKQKAQPEG